MEITYTPLKYCEIEAEYPMKISLTKQFERKQCRTCGGKVIPKRVCLTCNEPSVIWCETCFAKEDFLHVGHHELDLF